MPYHNDTDIESNNTPQPPMNYYSSIATSSRNISRINNNRSRSHHQSLAQQRQRIILFAILVTVSMTCVFISYIVSSATKPTCSDRIIWMPNCNREEYINSISTS